MSDAQGLVLVVDDDPSVRKAASRLFRAAALRVETFASAQQFLEFQRPDMPSCLILDVQMPGLNGMELQQRLADYHSDLPIVFMTGHGDIPMSVKAIKAGAVDFLPKPVDDELLLTTVQQALASHAENRQATAELQEFRHRLTSLTRREMDVLKLVITGKLNKQIAKLLSVTQATVKVHRGRVMEKLGVTSVAELVRLTERAGGIE